MSDDCVRDVVSVPEFGNIYVITGKNFCTIKLPYDERPEFAVLRRALDGVSDVLGRRLAEISGVPLDE